MPRAMRSTKAEMLNIRKEALQILIDLQRSETIRRKMWEDKLIARTKCGKNTAWMVVNEYIQQKNLVKRVLIVQGGQKSQVLPFGSWARNRGPNNEPPDEGVVLG